MLKIINGNVFLSKAILFGVLGQKKKTKNKPIIFMNGPGLVSIVNE